MKNDKPEQVVYPFSGFQEGDTIPIPDTFFFEILPILTEFNQLKLVLYLFWHHQKQEGKVRFFTQKNLASDPILLELVGGDAGLDDALSGLVSKDILLIGISKDPEISYFFFNSPQGHAAVKAIQEGRWREPHVPQPLILMERNKPNIFKLYEENIGVITPMMAEILKEDENAYPSPWIEDAIRIAVARNARNWKYVQAILERWQKEGRGNEQNRRNDSQDPDSYRESWLRKP